MEELRDSIEKSSDTFVVVQREAKSTNSLGIKCASWTNLEKNDNLVYELNEFCSISIQSLFAMQLQAAKRTAVCFWYLLVQF